MQASGEGVTTRNRSKPDVLFESLDPAIKDEILKTVKEAIIATTKEVIDTMKEKIQCLEQKVEVLEEQISGLLLQNASVSSKANDNEQYSRRHNVRIVGFPEEKDENCIEKVIKFCEEKLNFPLASTDVDRAHRVGRPKPNKHRAIIVRLQAHRHKIAILKNRKCLKGTNFFVNEDLTNENQKLFYQARKLEKVKSAWTKDGKIFVKCRDDNKLLRIASALDFIKYQLSNDCHFLVPE